VAGRCRGATATEGADVSARGVRKRVVEAAFSRNGLAARGAVASTHESPLIRSLYSGFRTGRLLIFPSTVPEVEGSYGQRCADELGQSPSYYLPCRQSQTALLHLKPLPKATCKTR